MSYTEMIRLLQKQAHTANMARIGYLKQILLMASALFGALLAFYRKPETPAAFPHILFALAMAGIVSGILLLSIALFEEASSQARLLLKYKEQLHNHEEIAEEMPTTFVNSKLIFLIAAKAGYVSLSLSLILFAVYLFV